MIEEIKDSYILEGIEIGETKGRIEELIKKIVRLLQLRFNQVPGEITDELNSRTDLVALDSLFDLAAQCKTLDEFAKALK